MSPNPQMQAAAKTRAPAKDQAAKSVKQQAKTGNSPGDKAPMDRQKKAEKSEHQGTVEYEMETPETFTLLTEQEKLDQPFSEEPEPTKDFGEDKLPERLRKDSDIRDQLKNSTQNFQHGKNIEKHHERKANRADLKHDVQAAPLDLGAETGGHKSHQKKNKQMPATKPDQSRSQKEKDRTLGRQGDRDAKMADVM